VAGLLQHGDYLIPLHAWELLGEMVNGVASFQVVEETLHWNARASEHRRPAEDFRVALDCGFCFHAYRLPPFADGLKRQK